MKTKFLKKILLLFLFISNLVFSQKKINATILKKENTVVNKKINSNILDKKVSENIQGIDIYIKEYNLSNIKSKEERKLMKLIIILENQTLEILAKNWIKYDKNSKQSFSKYLRKEFIKIQQFFNDNSHKIKNYKAQSISGKYEIYTDYLVMTNDMEAAGITGKWFDEY